MLKQMADLIVRKYDDWDNEIIEALEKSGFTIVSTGDTTLEKDYIIAKEIED